jgi:hypothetical protein
LGLSLSDVLGRTRGQLRVVHAANDMAAWQGLVLRRKAIDWAGMRLAMTAEVVGLARRARLEEQDSRADVFLSCVG